MKVRVHYTTQLKTTVGRATDDVELEDNATLGTLLEQLARRHGDPFRDMILDGSGGLLPSVLICIGDTQTESDIEASLNEGDNVTLLSPISGG